MSYSWTSFDTWIVVTGALAAAAAALPGCFLVLRRMSMMGDAISHAVLPGLAAAFILTGARSSPVMFLGAAVVGVLTALFTQWISKLGNVDRGAAMGIVFTTLFALGLLLIVQAADHVDLDPGCVLYGAIELTPLDTVEFTLASWNIQAPRAAVVLAAILLLNVLLIVLFFKELRLSSFDPALATSLGINASLLHYLLMTMVAITTVAAFEAVGSIIVIATLIVPPATALLLTNRLPVMLILSATLGAAAAFCGHLSAQILPPLIGFESTTTSGMIAVSTGFFFALAWIFSPREGLLAAWRHRRRESAPIPGESL